MLKFIFCLNINIVYILKQDDQLVNIFFLSVIKVDNFSQSSIIITLSLLYYYTFEKANKWFWANEIHVSKIPREGSQWNVWNFKIQKNYTEKNIKLKKRKQNGERDTAFSDSPLTSRGRFSFWWCVVTLWNFWTG